MELRIDTVKELSHVVKLESKDIIDLIVQKIYQQLGYPADTKASINILVEVVPPKIKNIKGKGAEEPSIPTIIVTISNPELPEVILTAEERTARYKNLEEKHG